MQVNFEKNVVNSESSSVENLVLSRIKSCKIQTDEESTMPQKQN